MTLDESVHGMRLRVIERAQVQGNVSAVCRELGISRTLFYRWRKRLERYGVAGVHSRRQRGQVGRPVATAPEVERLVGQITCQRQEKPANSFVSAPEPVALGDTLGPGGMPEG